MVFVTVPVTQLGPINTAEQRALPVGSRAHAGRGRQPTRLAAENLSTE
jgi:hypothetical protein